MQTRIAAGQGAHRVAFVHPPTTARLAVVRVDGSSLVYVVSEFVEIDLDMFCRARGSLETGMARRHRGACGPSNGGLERFELERRAFEEA